MQRKMSVPEAKGDTPGEKFQNALKIVASLPSDKAAKVRSYAPKRHNKKHTAPSQAILTRSSSLYYE